MPVVSLLQLDTSFPRIAGDIGSADTWRAELDIHMVPDLSVARVINRVPGDTDISGIAAAMAGARGDLLTTSCGFLCHWQDQLAANTSKPFVSSALLALPELRERYPGDELAILTFDSDVLTSPAFAPALHGFEGRVEGLPPGSHLRQVIAHDLPHLDRVRAENDILRLVDGLCSTTGVRALLLECTNLPPYKAALKAHFGLEIFDILTLVHQVNPDIVDSAFL